MFQRYAIYFTPHGDLAQAGAAWLGWDVAQGKAIAHPQIAGLNLKQLTERPRKYGLHGTIKAPFYLAEGTTAEGLEAALAALCARTSGVVVQGLEVSADNNFLALKAKGDQQQLNALAACVVTELDVFRRPPTPDELARRRRARLSAAQDAYLSKWGYPYVLDEFNFHITLSGRIKANAAQAHEIAKAYFAPFIPHPLLIDSLTLAGQDTQGMFHQIKRFALAQAR